MNMSAITTNTIQFDMTVTSSSRVMGKFHNNIKKIKLSQINKMNKGKIIQIIGPVVDVEFPEDTKLPAIYNALEVKGPAGKVVLEVVKHLDQTKVKAISLQSTDGLQRALKPKIRANKLRFQWDLKFWGIFLMLWAKVWKKIKI